MARHAGNEGGSLDRHVAGTTQRWTFDEGPTKGKTYEHTFHDDGTVSFREADSESPSGSPKGGRSAGAKAGDEKSGARPRYGVAHVSDGIHAVSYLSGAGYTLTVVLNEKDHTLQGFASNDKEWYPVRGRFEQVH